MPEIRYLDAGEARQLASRTARCLARHPRIRLVYLFGSAADDDAERVRDVDLAVLSEPPFEMMEWLRLRSLAIREVGGGPIDLVPLEDASIVLRHQVVTFGRCLYAASPDIETEFVVRSLARYWDWKPLLEEQWRLIAERQEARCLGSQT